MSEFLMKNSSKGNEKLMRPLFPRLNVNDTDKGGPRAPPRNKMALYEQLSIPSQRFRTDKEYVTPHCTAQESVHEAPSSGHTAERPLKNHRRQDAPVSQFEQLNKLDEDEFIVPIFLDSRKNQYAGKYCHNTGKNSPSIQINSNYSSTLQDSIDGNMKQNDVMQVRNNAGRQNKGISKNTVTSDEEDSFQYSLYSKGAERSLQQRATYEVNTPEDLLNHNGQLCEGTTFPSIQMIDEDRGDEASETSEVEFISVTDMSPDDVVGIIGLKHFWKARSEIVKQQKAFAFQVFELHRLIKVQKLIAGSPHLLLEDVAHIAKSVVFPDVKKLPMKAPPSNILKHRNDFEKIPRKRERSGENVENTSLSTVQKDYLQPPLMPNAGEPHMGSWNSYPSQAHQWLIPVMSLTEGLVYKPCSGQGFTSPVYGGPGPPGSGNFHPPGYGVLVPPAVPHGYFPSYSMPVVNAVRNTQASEHMGLQRQLSGGGANFSVQHQDSFHLQSQNSGPNYDVLKAQARTIEGNNPLPFSPSPVTDPPSCSQNGAKSVQQARVIRVVPHNRRSATESVARIFHSIQEERKQFDFV